MSDIQTGLMISVVGLLITFLALGLFIGVIYLLKLIFPYKPEQEETAEEGPEEAPALVEGQDEKLVAAIAAVAYSRQKQTGEPAPSKNPMWTSR